MDIEDDNIIQELEESATEHALSTDKNASTPTKTNTTKAQADNGSKNPAQAKVNRALNTITAYRDKLNMLKNRAAEKANEKKEARKARSVKKVNIHSPMIMMLLSKIPIPSMILEMILIPTMTIKTKIKKLRKQKSRNLHQKQNLLRMMIPIITTMP